ncbi:hypothetical protein [Aneurinibacillus migulanus]|uniref:Uncharacterized protein n=1 Tax=Aneurinibacillus migulanus TaxID=47500 RepID=A0A0D1Y0X7_ANEMI|nr:hypothetical protein [Aneurinibacillus migulanus]KIV52902.1 hypothetical protein TS65_22650 [Aneurinibacillus migulanus]KON95179.1 hypothetical protein AF333_06490 [Aneurinibacillus migulanus]MED0890914.1 hypothetical protein [Aneurinibacillus migulanus]MED1616606.1 hypothetical protein [Aneurinibacillus migulanus]SDI82461.1 hypothetical protein SAMN04487909_10869 [Aneurinibacillus migulanus]
MFDITDLLQNDEDPGQDIMIKLRWAREWALNRNLKIEDFNKNHGWNLNEWREAKYISRDIIFKDSLLIRIPALYRRNFLAYDHGFTKKELANVIDESENKIGDLLNIKRERTPRDGTFEKMAIALDVPLPYLKIDNYDRLENDEFIEYEHVAERKKLEQLSSIFHDKLEGRNVRGFVIINESNYMINEERLYARFETNDVYYRLEFFVRRNCGIHDAMNLRKQFKQRVDYMIFTPATLRKNYLKLIFTGSYTKDAKKFQKYIDEMKKRKYTRVVDTTGEYIRAFNQ